MSKIEINGVKTLPIKEITIDKNRIWSSKTGRTANGNMKGDIVAYKDTLKIVFSPLSDTQAALLENAVHPAFFKVTYQNPGTGKTRTGTFYTGTPSYPVYSYVDGYPRYVGVGIELIEQ